MAGAGERDSPAPHFFFLAFVLALALRLTLLLGFPGNYDTASYEEVITILERGGDLYADTSRYNYSPVWSLVLRSAQALSKVIGSDLVVAVGLLLLLADGLTAALLFRIAAARRGRSAGFGAALLFFANPVSVLISSAHGQFDNLPILFLLVALLAAQRRPARRVPILAALSASLLVKHVTAFHPLLFARRRERGGAGLGAAVVPYLAFALSFLPYLASLQGIRSHVLEYSGLRSLYGTDALLLIPGVPDWVPVAVFIPAAGLAVFVLRNVELGRASLLLFLVILIFAPGISRQYFVWPIALGSLFGGPGYFVYTAVSAASIFQLARPAGEGIAFGPGWYGPWWAAIGWLLWEVRELRGLRSAGAKRPAEKSLRNSPP
jgi:hypothetical protein